MADKEEKVVTSDETKADSSKKKKRAIRIAIIIIIIIIILLLLKFCGGNTEKGSGTVYNPNVSISDETPEGDGRQKNIIFPGYSKSVITYSAGETMSMQNPKGNRVDFVYTILFEDEEVFTSEKIAPGETYKWDVRSVFTQPGTYEITIKIAPYAEDGTVKNGLNQNYTFAID